MTKSIDFYFDIISPYSYLAHKKIGTLRKKGFCSAWDIFVQLGMTDDSYLINCKNLSYRDFINSYLVYSDTKSVEDKISELLAQAEELSKNNEITDQDKYLVDQKIDVLKTIN